MSRKTKSSFGRDSLQSRSSITGASASKLPRSTPLPPSSRKVFPSHSKTGARSSSYFGGTDHHVMKDTRPLTDKGYIRKCIHELIAFLTDMGYPHPLSVKQMSPPTNKEYFRIVEFVYGLLSPNYKMVVRPEEETSKILQDLNYPFNISKSTLNNIGAMSAWPNALGALDWLVDLVKYDNSLENNELNEMLFGGDKKQEVFHRYLQATYTAFMHGENAPFTEIDNTLSQQIIEMNKDLLNEVEDLKLKSQQQAAEKENFLKEKAEESDMEQELINLQKMKKDLEEYLEKLDKYCASVKDQCKAVEGKFNEIDSMCTQLEESNKDIQSTVAGQELSIVDVQNMKIETDQIKSAIKAMETRCQQLQDSHYEKQIEQSKKIDQITSQIVEYTETCRELQLIPETALNAEGVDYSLSTNRSQIDKNVEKLYGIIRPKLMTMKSQFLKEFGKLQQERNHNATVIEQLKEQVADQKRVKETLEQQLIKLREEEHQQKNEFDHIKEEQCKEIEDIKEEIRGLKTMNSLSLDDVKAQVKMDREGLKTLELNIAKERDELDDSVARLCKLCLEYKEKTEKLFVNFNNNINATTKRFLPQLRESAKRLESNNARLDELAIETKKILQDMTTSED